MRTAVTIVFTWMLALIAISAQASMLNDANLVAEVLSGKRTEANATWWGFDPEDSTRILQAAIDSGAHRLIVPNVGSDWIVRPLQLRGNLELVLEDGVVIKAKKGEYLGIQDSVFTATDVDNLTIRGYGAVIEMNKEDYMNPPYDKAEWRTGVKIRGSKNVQIVGVTIRDTGGDGIYLGRGRRKVNENVVIRDVILDNNYRQGISVISAKNLLIENTVIKNTSGTAPMAGIDFEPNQPDEFLENIIVRNSVIENNEGNGIIVYVARLNRQSNPVSILVENVVVRGNNSGIVMDFVDQSDTADYPRGTLKIRQCVVEHTRNSGILIVNKRDEDLWNIKVEDCVLYHAGESLAARPIRIESNHAIHNVEIRNVTVVDDRLRPAIYGLARSLPRYHGFLGISGDLKIANPHGFETIEDLYFENLSFQFVPAEEATQSYTQLIESVNEALAR